MTREFLDTNVIVYSLTSDPRSVIAQTLLERGCVISVQVLSELAHVARRKLGMSWPEVEQALADVLTLCPEIAGIDRALQLKAVGIAARYRLTIYDGQIVAAAMAARCDTLWSEDLQHGQEIESGPRIMNPFHRA